MKKNNNNNKGKDKEIEKEEDCAKEDDTKEITAVNFENGNPGIEIESESSRNNTAEVIKAQAKFAERLKVQL